MEERKFTEKESIELISQMIKQSKQSMKVGSGNIFLIYGYSATVISIIVFALTSITGQGIWAMIWLLMFLPGIIIKLKAKNQSPQATTYIDSAIDNTWKVIGMLFGLTIVAISLIGLKIGVINFVIMLPLGLLYAGIGTSITGVITKKNYLTYTPLFAFAIAIYMTSMLASNQAAETIWHIYFGLSFFVMMVIPGHILNKKSTESC